MIYQLEPHVANTLKEFFNQFDFIDKVVIFGSRAKHTANPKSDIDLCIYSLEMTDIQFSKLKSEIDELPILYKIDVVHFEKVNKELQDNVERNGKLLFKKYIKLEDVSLNSGQYGSNSKAVEYDSNKPRYLRITDIDNNGKLSDKKVSPSKIEEKYYLNKNDFLFARSGSVGRTYLHDKNAEELQFAGYLIKYILDLEKIYPKFLFYFTKSEIYNNWIEGNKNTVAQTNINAKQFLSLIFSLPTLTKQKKIANALDKASELVTLRKESIQKLDELSKSIFIDMFGDPVSNSKKWNLVTCIDSSSCIVPGRDKPKSFSGTIPWITTNDLIDKGFIDKSKNNIGLSQEEIRKSKAKIIPKNSVIFTCVGDLGIVSITKNNIVMNQQLHSFQCKENVNNCFLMYNISMQKDYMYKMASSTTLPYMNKTICNNIPLILPPITLQTKFATIIEKIEEQKALYEKELKLLENNFDSLLDESFN